MTYLDVCGCEIVGVHAGNTGAASMEVAWDSGLLQTLSRVLLLSCFCDALCGGLRELHFQHLPEEDLRWSAHSSGSTNHQVSMTA